MSVLTNYQAVVAAMRLDKKRKRSKRSLWTLASYAGCLLIGLTLCLAAAAVFELEDDEFRRNILNLVATLATLTWIGSGTVLHLGLSPTFDYRVFLPLPVGLRGLYSMRVAAGLSGLWLLVFGPVLLYLLAYKTAGFLGFGVALLAAVALVISLGRLVAIALLSIENLSSSWLTTVVLMAAIASSLLALEPTIQGLILDSQEEPAASVVAVQIRDARVLDAMGYLPGGLLVGIFHSPEAVGANLARLAGLWFVALACMAIEYRLLSRRLLDSLSTSAVSAGIHFSLVPILSRVRHLTPNLGLCLIEIETLMRMNWYRGMMLVTLFLLPVVQTGSVYVLTWTTIMISAAFLNVRVHAFGVAHRSIAERFSLPVRLAAPARAYSAALSAFPALVLLATICWAWYRVGWPGFGIFGLWLALPFCTLVGGHGAGVYQSARAPSRFDFTPYSGKLASSSPLWPSVAFNVAMISVPLLLAFLAPRASWGPAAALCGSAVLIVGAIVFNSRMLDSAERLVCSDPHRILDSLTNRR